MPLSMIPRVHPGAHDNDDDDDRGRQHSVSWSGTWSDGKVEPHRSVSQLGEAVGHHYPNVRDVFEKPEEICGSESRDTPNSSSSSEFRKLRHISARKPVLVVADGNPSLQQAQAVPECLGPQVLSAHDPNQSTLEPRLKSAISTSGFADDELFTHWEHAALHANAELTQHRHVVIAHPDRERWSPALVLAAMQAGMARRSKASLPACEPNVIIVTATPAEAEQVFTTASLIVASALETAEPLPFTAMCFTEKNKFVEDVQRILSRAGSSSTIVVGTIRRVADLVSRGALRTTSLQSLMISGSENILSVAVQLDRLKSMMKFIDVSRVQICATCLDKASLSVELTLLGFAPIWSRWHPSDISVEVL